MDTSTTTDDDEKADRSIPGPNPVLLLQHVIWVNGRSRGLQQQQQTERRMGIYRNRIKRFEEEEKVNIKKKNG